MAQLTGGNERVELGGGYALRAPGLRGRAEVISGSAPDRGAREASTTLVEEVLASAGMSTVRTVEIAAGEVPAPPAGDLRDAQNNEALVLEVPDLGPEAGQVVLSIDEAGGLRWHFPLEGPQLAIQPAADRGAGGTKRFYIPRTVVPSPPPADARDRALFGAIGRKLLKAIVYPITDALIGQPARAIAERWESANRAYGIRRFTPDDYRDGASATALTSEAAQQLAGGRALLFLHGTFSTAHGAFHDLPPELMRELHARYGGRVFAFNHFSVSHDPRENVKRLLDGLRQLAPGAPLELDVVSHSRGGLVARTIAVGQRAFDLDTEGLRPRRVIFVAVPNKGTLLAHPDHVVHMIDRLTTGLNFLPPGGVADVLEGILIAVKIIGHGALAGLHGLSSMNPSGDFLAKLNGAGGGEAEYFAVAANYEPVDNGLKALVSRSVDVVVDRVFEGNENDLVVPERGVYEENGASGFPIPADHHLRLPGSAGVIHTGLFGHPEVAGRLGQWLQG